MKWKFSRSCKDLTRYSSAYLAAQEAANRIGKWSFYSCKKCRGWHVKNN